MKRLIFILILLSSFILPLLIYGQDQGQTPPVQPTTDPYGLSETAKEAGLIQENQNPATVSQIIGLIINAALGLIGVIYLIIIIYSGFQWMTAGGNEETIAKAKKRLINATIGIIIVFAAFIITNFVVFKILEITLPTSS